MMFLGRRPSSLLVFAAFIAISECNPISQRDVTHSTLQEYGVKVSWVALGPLTIAADVLIITGIQEIRAYVRRY